MNEPKNHHFVPQALLRGFAQKGKTKTRQIHVYDKKENKTFHTNIKNVAVKNNHNKAEPLDVISIVSNAMKVARQAALECLGGKYDSLARKTIRHIDAVTKRLEQDFYPSYKERGLDKILLDPIGLEKKFSLAESEAAKILRKIHGGKEIVKQEELKSLAAVFSTLATNNPKCREYSNHPQVENDHPLAQMGNYLPSLLGKISKYKYYILSTNKDMFVTSDFPMLFLQKCNDTWAVRFPYNFALSSNEEEGRIYMPISPNKMIMGFDPSLSVERNIDAETAVRLANFFNGLMWDFADRFIYAKNEVELNFAKTQAGQSIPAGVYNKKKKSDL